MARKKKPSRFSRKTFTGPSRTPPTLWSTPKTYQQENIPEGTTPAVSPAPGNTGVQGSTSGPSNKRKRGRPKSNPPVDVNGRPTVGQLRLRPTIRPVEVTFPVGETQITSPTVTPTMTTMASAPASTGLTGNYGDLRLLAETSKKFRTRVVNVQPGENVATKIFQCTKKGKRQICIFSASGAVSGVKIWRSDGGMVTHEGCYDIISLSASLVSPTRGLYVTLLAGNGLVTIGGAVSDVLIAASPILIVIGTFKLKRPRKKKNRQEDTATSSTQEDTSTSSAEAISGP